MIMYNILLFIPICIFTLKLNYILNLYLNKNVLYLNHTSTKRRYITKNIVKSIILFIITIITVKSKYDIYRYNYWNNFLIHTIGSFYVSNDVLGLILIKDLSRSTKFHHIISTILLFINYTIDYTKNTSDMSIEIGKLLVVYASFSSYSFIVNFTLGYRFLVDKNSKIINKLKKISFYIYLISCGMNWGLQIYFLYIFNNISVIVKFFYLLIICPIVNDDIVLMTWLNKND